MPKLLLLFFLFILLGAGCSIETKSNTHNTPGFSLRSGVTGIEKIDCPEHKTTVEVSSPKNDEICVFIRRQYLAVIHDTCEPIADTLPSEPYNLRCFSSKGMTKDQMLEKASSTAWQIKYDQEKERENDEILRQRTQYIQDALNQ